MKTVYQLMAKGYSETLPSSPIRIASKQVYLDRARAEAAIPEFKAKCCAGGLFDPDPESTTVSVLELELIE